ncbi:ANTAR domain-containing response regulator [Candidatus Methylobacter oryzae]|uniref:ANTAR domain-containing protein n=1 Tax=Candidatus Methylobacter oryzae TaxID=2497749 RepID=A0ABY3CER7_9GAMM|nr:ANTAR domain-containing protein [Candidatus Methylobacter oryzae]TRW95886.1 ANTAR domain-containing protein [Candidatus Methylobacter oryzae]
MNALNILLIENETAGRLLKNILVTEGYSVVDTAKSKSNIQSLVMDGSFDLVIFNIDSPKKYFQDIHYISQHRTLPVIIFAADETADTINQIVKAGVSAYIVNGLEAGRINSIIAIAVARFKEQQRLRSELEKTKAKLEERKLIDRAKGILIKARGFTEDDAYHALRKLAMDRNITIGEMAKNIIAMAELLK